MIGLLIILCSSVNAYYFTEPTPYYYDSSLEKNVRVNMSFIRQFEVLAYNYFDYDLELEFTTDHSREAWGHTYCYSLGGRIDIVIYRSIWSTYNYRLVKDALEHELKHAYQCRVLKEWLNHEDINLWR